MINYLEERIVWYDDNYRNGNALISDRQFDHLEKNLLRTNPNCDYFKNKNKLVLSSLVKDSTDEFLRGLLPDTRLLIEPKIDGCAVALQYRDGTLEKAISRKGTDVTKKLIDIQGIPKNLALRGILQVRGELYAPNESSMISQKIASGFLRAKEGFSESLSFCSFQILNSKLNQFESKKSLEKLGFTILEDISCNFTSQVKLFRQEWLKGKLFKKYPTDGIVVKINSRKLQLIREKSNLNYPYWQVAIKS